MDINEILAQLAAAAPNRADNAERVATIGARGRSKFAEKAKHWINRWNAKFKEAHGYDGLAELQKPGFSLTSVERQLRERKLREDQTQSQLYSLTTGLVTLDMSKEYETVPVVYRELAKIVPSTKSEESYFPLQRTDVPVPLEENEAPPSSGLGGNLTRIRNYRFGRILEYSCTLEEDDQTGQVREAAGDLGQKMAYAEEKWWLQQLFVVYVAANIRNIDGGSNNGIVPGACIAGSAPANYGGPTTTAAPVSRDGIANLFTAADFITDIEGDLGLVEVNVGLFSNADKITVRTILQSPFNPNTTSASANVLNGIFAENPLKDLFVAKFTRFMKYFLSSALNGGNPWFLGEAGKFGSFQDRTPLAVTMESPLAGKSWESNTRRTKAERRFGAGVTLPEFVLRGN